MVLTLPITEASYRYVELPIRQGRIGEMPARPAATAIARRCINGADA